MLVFTTEAKSISLEDCIKISGNLFTDVILFDFKNKGLKVSMTNMVKDKKNKFVYQTWDPLRKWSWKGIGGIKSTNFSVDPETRERVKLDLIRNEFKSTWR